MHARILTIVLAAIFFVNDASSQIPTIEWQRCYGGVGSQQTYNMQKTSDGGYIVCAGNAVNPVPEDYLVIKIDALGNPQWQRTYGGGGYDHPQSIEQTNDGGYIVAGWTSSNNGDITNNHGEYDCWIVRLNSSGDIIWQKTYGGSQYDGAWTIRKTADGGYIVGCESESSDGDITGAHGLTDFWIFKIDDLGNLLWQKTFGGSSQDVMHSLIPTSDGGYIFIGTTGSNDGDVSVPGFTQGGTWIVKLDAAANIVWQKIYGVDVQGYGYSICQTNDGGYAFSGLDYYHGNHGWADMWIGRLDASGNMLWQNVFGGSDLDGPTNSGCIIQTSDGGFLVPGNAYSHDGNVIGNHGPVGTCDAWLVKVNPAGALEWQKPMGGDKDDVAIAITEIPDNHFTVACFTASDNTGDVGPNTGVLPYTDVWVVRLGPDILPVSLTGFNALAKEKNVVCSWQTQQEQNSNYFIIQRSDDAIHFIDAGSIPAKGNSTVPVDYSFTDKNVLLTDREYLYYRLKMVDIDRSARYSEVKKINLPYHSAISIYPNPVVDLLYVDLISPVSERATLIINDNSGKKVYETTITLQQGKNTIPVSTAVLAKGNYILCVKGKNNYSAGFIK